MQVQSPNGGESWAFDSQHEILWTSQGADGKVVRIVLRQGSKVIGEIAKNKQATIGKFLWTVGKLLNGTAPGRERVHRPRP